MRDRWWSSASSCSSWPPPSRRRPVVAGPRRTELEQAVVVRAGGRRAAVLDRLGRRPQHRSAPTWTPPPPRRARPFLDAGLRGRPVPHVRAGRVGRDDAGVLRLLPRDPRVGAVQPSPSEGAAVVMQLPDDADVDASPTGWRSSATSGPTTTPASGGAATTCSREIGTPHPRAPVPRPRRRRGARGRHRHRAYAGRRSTTATGEATGSTALDEVVEAVGRAAGGRGLRRRPRVPPLAMGNADPADQDAADRLVEAAGRSTR